MSAADSEVSTQVSHWERWKLRVARWKVHVVSAWERWELHVAVAAIILIALILISSIAFGIADSRKTPPCFLPGNGKPVCAPE